MNAEIKYDTITVKIRSTSVGENENLEFVKKISKPSFIEDTRAEKLILSKIKKYLIYFDHFPRKKIEKFTKCSYNFFLFSEGIEKMFDDKKDEEKNLNAFLFFAKMWKKNNKKNIFNYLGYEKQWKEYQSFEIEKNLKKTYLRIGGLSRIESLKQLSNFVTIHEESFWDEKQWNKKQKKIKESINKNEWKIYLNNNDWDEIQTQEIKNDWKLEVKTENFILPGCYFITHPDMNLMFKKVEGENERVFNLLINDKHFVWRRGEPKKFRASDFFYLGNEMKAYRLNFFLQKHLCNKKFWKFFFTLLGNIPK